MILSSKELFLVLNPGDLSLSHEQHHKVVKFLNNLNNFSITLEDAHRLRDSLVIGRRCNHSCIQGG